MMMLNKSVCMFGDRFSGASSAHHRPS